MPIDLERLLNPEQARAASSVEGPVLIIAGAGSGKTRMITYRIAHMLELGIKQSEILALTFTNKAAAEMAERISSVVGRSLQLLTASTFHAFGLSILRTFGHLVGYSPRFTVYDQQDRQSMIKTVLSEMKIDPKSIDMFDLAEAISAVKTGLADLSGDYSKYRPIFDEYQSHLKLYQAVDFDDLILQPLRLFSVHPEVLAHYRQKLRFILVDEFQDTSLQQYQMVHLLAEQHRNLCVVGDDDQSIYSWRGADYRNIVHFERDFPECLEIKLERNYRSTGSIISAANALISNNTKRKEKRLWTGESGDGTIALSHPENDQDEAEFIAEKIREVKIRGSLSYDDFGVLVRTNSLISSIERAFLSLSVPYKVSGGQSFFQRKEIKDVISYLRILANPDDDVSLLRIINTPKRGFGKQSLEFFRSVAEKQKCSLFSAMTASAKAADSGLRESLRRIGEEFIEFLELHRAAFFSGKPLTPSLTAMLADISYRNHLISEHPDNEQLAQWKMKQVDLFVSILDRWERSPATLKKSLYDFLGTITLKEKNEPEQEQGKVNLMTIHASKGLEFHTVFLAGAEDHILPHRRSIEEHPDAIEEERRLFYVAITRARVNLFMTSCRTRQVLREETVTVPSRFLAELPPDIIAPAAKDSVADSSSAGNYFSMLRARLSGTPGQG